jgi:hypothetical protein
VSSSPRCNLKADSVSEKSCFLVVQNSGQRAKSTDSDSECCTASLVLFRFYFVGLFYNTHYCTECKFLECLSESDNEQLALHQSGVQTDGQPKIIGFVTEKMSAVEEDNVLYTGQIC